MLMDRGRVTCFNKKGFYSQLIAKVRPLVHVPGIAPSSSYFKPGILARLLLLFMIVKSPSWSDGIDVSDNIAHWAEAKYGKEARDRVLALRELIAASRQLPETHQIANVNDFFNRLKFEDDMAHWGQEDYWATPLETLASGGGDCEDMAIAKYFTLTAIGMSEEKLQITYVKALDINQAHMVLTYFSEPDATPLVLDNLEPLVKSASDRKDLLPIYGFNGTGLWLARERQAGKLVGGAGDHNLWRELLQRMGR